MKRTKISGIYMIMTLSGNRYIGSALSFEGRWRRHVRQLKAGTHHNPGLQRAANKDGIDSLIFLRVLSVLYPDKETLLSYEQAFIDELKPELNVCKIAGSTQGRVHSAETRAKIAAAVAGTRTSEELSLCAWMGWTAERHAAHLAAMEAQRLDINSVFYRTSKVSVTTVEGTVLERSVHAAFTRFGLPVGMHKAFRSELKQRGKNVFTHAGKDYLFELA